MSITNNTLYTLLLHTPNPQCTQSRLTHKTAIMKRNHQLKAGFRQLTAQEVSFQALLSICQEAASATQSVGALFPHFLPRSGFRLSHSPERSKPGYTFHWIKYQSHVPQQLRSISGNNPPVNPSTKDRVLTSNTTIPSK